MNKEDIVFGLRNAVERGFSLQSAVQSFLNAGYNPGEVNDAAREINMGVLGRMEQQKTISMPKTSTSLDIPSPTQDTTIQRLPSQTEPVKKRLSPILIALIVFVVLLILGAVMFSFFGESLLNALFK